MRKLIGGVGSLLTLAILLVGIPVALIALAGNPIPNWGQISDAFTLPDYGGRFLIGNLLPVVAWIAWATFAIGFLVELPAYVRKVRAPRIPGLGFQQRTAAVLIAAIALMFTVSAVAPVAPASAQETTSSVSASASFSSVAETPAATVDAPASAAKTAPAPETAQLPTYTVQDGDSLWRIAEKTLGSGQRFGEIAQLNLGVPQADGNALTEAQWLNAGWVLKLPADAAAAATGAPVETQHTVQPGETLWGIAQTNLGAGEKFTEIVDATAGHVQPDGQTLTDPSLIRPGWVVDIPGAAAAVPAAATAAPAAPVPIAPSAPATAETPAAPAPTATPSPSTSGSTAAAPQSQTPVAEPSSTTPDQGGIGISTAAPATSAPANSTPAAAHPSIEETSEKEAWIDEIFNVRTAGGIGALLAAGLLGVLGLRRAKQRRRRRPGQRISMPSTEATEMELELRAVENPMGMDDVDHALRYLGVWAQDTGSPLPPLYALRLAETEISLLLDAPMDLPEPFVCVSEDRQAWIIDPAQLPELTRVPSAPYPALVTVGQDPTDAHILLDLEHLGALNITGPDSATSGALTALALELATSRWAEDLQITLVGIAEGLPSALDTGRVRHIDDIPTLLRNLRGQAQATELALAELGADSIEHARAMGADAQAWIPEIVILGELPDEQTQAELAELVTRLPRVGIAAVSAGHLTGQWEIAIAPGEAILKPIGLPINPQVVSTDEYQRIVELMGATESEAVAGPDWSTRIQDEEISLDELPPATETVDIVAVSAAQGIQDDEDDDSWKDALRSMLPPKETPAATASVGGPAVAAEEPTDPFEQLRNGPFVRLLGPVSLEGSTGPEPRSPQSGVDRSTMNRATELIAFLTLNPGANAVQVHNALWPGKDPSGDKAAKSRNGLTSRARRWLGNALDGAQYFPPVGTQGYRLHDDVRSDWDLWLDLVGEDVTTTPTKNLIAALKLVEGQPFGGVKDKYYVWAERIRQEMIASIGDAAHELATRSLKHGDVASARLAGAIGRQVDPVNEILWRDALLAEHQADDVAGAERIFAQFEEQLDALDDGYEPEPETQQLIDEIRSRHAIAG